jgi:hypothetical protein
MWFFIPEMAEKSARIMAGNDPFGAARGPP